jgi:chemotaxis protein CheC
MSEPGALAQDELDLLQELMNVAFGKASADLAAARSTDVGLTVPNVQAMPAVLIRYYLGAELKGEGRVGVVAQAFRGGLEGGALLVLPETVGEAALREIGEVLVRACVERLGELLGTSTWFEPPSIAFEGRREAAARAERFQNDSPAVVLRSSFQLGAPPAAGHLFLAASRDSVSWLKTALPRFLAQYA